MTTLREIKQMKFAEWIRQQDRSTAAEWLHDVASEGRPYSLVNDLLQFTGDEKYTPETYLKAVDLLQEVQQ